MSPAENERALRLLYAHGTISRMREFVLAQIDPRMRLVLEGKRGKTAPQCSMQFDRGTAEKLLPVLQQLLEHEMRLLGVDWEAAQ